MKIGNVTHLLNFIASIIFSAFSTVCRIEYGILSRNSSWPFIFSKGAGRKTTDVEVSRGAGRTYQVARTLSRLDQVEGGFGYPTPSSEPVTSRPPLCLLLLFHSNQLEKRRTLSLARGIHGPLASISRARANPGRTPLKYHVSYGRKKSRRIHTQIGTRKVSSLFLSFSLTRCTSCESGSFSVRDRCESLTSVLLSSRA